jgi:hypothetical protein
MVSLIRQANIWHSDSPIAEKNNLKNARNTSKIPGRPATVTHQVLKGRKQEQKYLPQFGCKQQQWHRKQQQKRQQQSTARMTSISWPLTTAGTQATAGIKATTDRQHSMDDSKSRNAVKIRDNSSSRDNSIIMDVISNRTARIDSRQQHSAGTPAIVAGTHS